MNEAEIIFQYAERLFSDHADLQSVNNSKDEAWKKSLWEGFEEIGLKMISVPEKQGGIELGIQSALEICRMAGNFAIALPVCETMLSAWILGQAGMEIPEGKILFGPSDFSDEVELREGKIHAHFCGLNFAREADYVILPTFGAEGAQIHLMKLQAEEIRPFANMAFDASDQLLIEGRAPVASAPLPVCFSQEAFMLVGALMRSMQIAGALEKILTLTVDYANQRRAFGRTISKFQTIQHSIAQLAGESAVAKSTAASAADALNRLMRQRGPFSDPEILLEILSAKIRSASAAQKAFNMAHQIHGAIGVTKEHVLHRLTLRALAWSADYGNEHQWSVRLGKMIARQGSQNLWSLISSR